MDMRESKERALGTQNECFRTFCRHLEKCLPFVFTGVYVYVKKSSGFKDQKPISSTFKALEIGPLDLKDFQDTYELRHEKY